MNAFRNFLRYLQKIRRIFRFLKDKKLPFGFPKLSNKTKGYVVLLLVIFVPLIMLGTKWALDVMTLHDVQINMRQPGGKAYRMCARQVALAVAQNWNSAMILDQQKTSLLKVADKVYNDSPAYDASSKLSKAVPGIQIVTKKEVIPGKGFDPIRITTQSNIPNNFDLIKYKFANKYTMKKRFSPPNEDSKIKWNLPFVTWKLIDDLTSSKDIIYDKFDELDQTAYQEGKYILNHIDRYQYPHQWHIKKDNGYPTREAFLTYATNSVDIICTVTSSTSDKCEESGYSEDSIKKLVSDQLTYTNQGNSTKVTNGYTYREVEDNQKVQLSVEKGRIKAVATSDSLPFTDVGYAVPAECNVDIVLACPTNAAACNNENRDINTTVVKYPYSTRNDTVDNNIQACPIYQIGQAFRIFAKEFYHIRGVTMGLIPYSGKVSLSPEVAEKYTEHYSKYNGDAYFQQDYYSTDQNTYQPYLRSYVLYDSYGLKDKDLNTNYKWNTLLTGCPIRCRCGLCDKSLDMSSGGNIVYTGNILSTAAPSVEDTSTTINVAKFFRQNSNPCCGVCANLLSMRCEKDCATHWPNPYYIIEPTANVQKIYEICGALYPFYDERNVSNFLFIPITWANNLWQSWTRDPACNAVDTDASGNGGQLSVPSKMTAGRKKVLILVANKPDWFEPNELTYLGFDNDYSELPMMESDIIRFDINYSAVDSKYGTRRYANGEPHNGTIQGQKQILKFTHDGNIAYQNGYYECTAFDTAVSSKLSFPKKSLIKLIIEPTCIKWEEHESDLINIASGDWRNYGHMGVGPVNGVDNQFLALRNRQCAYSPDGIKWTAYGFFFDNNSTRGYLGATYGLGTWIAVDTPHSYPWGILCSTDQAQSWFRSAQMGSWVGVKIIYFANNRFMVTISEPVNDGLYTSSMGTGNWVQQGKMAAGNVIGFAQDKWILGPYNGMMYGSRDNGITWKALDSSLSSVATGTFFGATCTGGYFYVINGNNRMVARSLNGRNWEAAGVIPCTKGGSHYNITLFNGKLYAFGATGSCCHIAEKISDAKIKFTNIDTLADSALTKDEYIITGRAELYIEPSQISNAQDSDGKFHLDFELTNMRLVSAEITNCPYKKVKRICSINGSTISTNCEKPVVLKARIASSSLGTEAIFKAADDCTMKDRVFSKFSTFSPKESFSIPSSELEIISTDPSKNRIEYSLKNTKISKLELYDSKSKLLHSLEDGGITLGENEGKKYIQFSGTGNLLIEIMSEKCSTLSEVGKTENSLTFARTSEEKIIAVDINPDDYTFNGSNNSYTVSLNLKDMEVIDIQFHNHVRKNVDSLSYTWYDFEFEPISIPDTVRVIDFTQKGDDNGLVYYILGQKMDGDNYYLKYQRGGTRSCPNISWNNNGYWQMTGDYWGYARYDIMLMMYPGDAFIMTKDTQGPIYLGYTRWSGFYIGSSLCRHNILFSGTNYAATVADGLEYWYGHIGLPLFVMGATMPINTALYYGSGDNNTHEYEWQSNKSGVLSKSKIEITQPDSTTIDADMVIDATMAAKNVTVDACKKLQNDWKQNLRIYLIKYRCQPQYKHKTTAEVKDFDYTYLDACATSSDLIYNIDETTDPNISGDQIIGFRAKEALSNTLKEIAKSIKDWAEYKEAKNTE